MMTGVTFGSDRIRRWMDRSQVASLCRWKPGTVTGLRLVLWTDVLDRAEEAIRRQQELELERRRESLQEERLRAAVADGEAPKDAGERLGIHPARVAKFLDRWEAAARQEARDERLKPAN